MRLDQDKSKIEKDISSLKKQIKDNDGKLKKYDQDLKFLESVKKEFDNLIKEGTPSKMQCEVGYQPHARTAVGAVRVPTAARLNPHETIDCRASMQTSPTTQQHDRNTVLHSL